MGGANAELAPVAQSAFISASNVVRSLLEDASTAALTTALSTLPYAPADTKRWIATLNSLQAPPAPPLPPLPRKHLFTLFTGSYHPALDSFSVADLAGSWHIAHFLDTPPHYCHAMEETLIQRFAAGRLEPVVAVGAGGGGGGAAAAAGEGKRKREDGDEEEEDGAKIDWADALSFAPGELWERLGRRWLELVADPPLATKYFHPLSLERDLISKTYIYSVPRGKLFRLRADNVWVGLAVSALLDVCPG